MRTKRNYGRRIKSWFGPFGPTLCMQASKGDVSREFNEQQKIWGSFTVVNRYALDTFLFQFFIIWVIHRYSSMDLPMWVVSTYVYRSCFYGQMDMLIWIEHHNYLGCVFDKWMPFVAFSGTSDGQCRNNWQQCTRI